MTQTQNALLLLSKHGKIEVGTRPIPSPEGKQALVKVTAAAINPVDWMIIEHGLFLTEFPAVLGLDGAGIIESIGPEVTTFQKGERILFQGEFAPSDVATFQQYALVDTDVISKIPENISDDQASTIPSTSVTSLFGLFQNSGIAFPENGPTATGKAVFILGGSTSVGQYAIQLARIAGFSAIATTASAQHTEYLKSLGATHVFDRDVELDTVRAAIPTPFSLIFDIVASLSAQTFAVDLLTTSSPAPGAHFAGIRPLDASLQERVKDKVSVNVVFGSSHRFKDLSVPYWRILGKWIQEGKIVPNRVQVVGGGLAGISKAFELSKKGVSGVKLVVHPQE